MTVINISPRNIGVDWTRSVNEKTSGDQINLEKIFMEEWNKENSDVPWINNGLGIAQLLMIINERKAQLFYGPDQDYPIRAVPAPEHSEVCVYNLTEREYRIIATIIQWLGTNVGFSFLNKCLRKANYMIKEIEPFKEPVPESEPIKKGRFRILELD